MHQDRKDTRLGDVHGSRRGIWNTDKKLIAFILFFCSLAFAQRGEQAIVASSAVIPGPFNYTVIDWGQCTNASVPTSGCVGSSTYPSLPSGMTFTITNTNTDFHASNAESYTWPTFTLTGGSWPNTSTLSAALTLGTAGDGIHYNFASGGFAQTSNCVPIYTNWPQSTGLTSRVDLWDLDSNGGTL